MSDTIIYISGGLVATILVFVLVIFFVLGIINYRERRKYRKQPKATLVPLKESYVDAEYARDGLTIYNYLEVPIEAIYYDPKGKSKFTLHPFIPAQTYVSIAKSNVSLEKGGRVQFFYKPSKNAESRRIYKDYVITNPNLPQEIHVGMVTTKSLNFTSPVIYAGAYEMRFIIMHNRLDIPITINGHIRIEPGQFYKYDGYIRDGGASVGEIFRNDEGYFPPIEIEIPVTDLYFGVVDDKPLAIYQGQRYLWDDGPPPVRW